MKRLAIGLLALLMFVGAICALPRTQIRDVSRVYGAPTPYRTPRPYPTPKRYIRGPNGGCYYNDDAGNKIYVDRSYCGY